ncbi:MAG: dienelactone hydrolase family protein [Gemmatales bacterium]|nr:dienelactone hydrolase family protein [Gemmatales bacterium]
MIRSQRFIVTKMTCLLVFAFLGTAITVVTQAQPAPPATLPDTQPLDEKGDLAQIMLSGLHKFLDRKTRESQAARERYWRRDFSSPEAYWASLEPQRQRLAHILGVRDPRVQPVSVEVAAPLGEKEAQPGLTNSAPPQAPWTCYYIRWQVFPTYSAEGLVLIPKDEIRAEVIAVPDADLNPEDWAVLPCWQDALRAGCRIWIPTLVSRTVEPRLGRAKMSHREFIYRPAYELGRHIIGYEIQALLSLVDYLAPKKRPITILGYGEGGLLALYTAALERRVHVALISGYFGPRENLWQEPIERNVFGLLEQFGDAELATMVAPRPLIVEASPGPELEFPSQGGAPGKLTNPKLEAVQAEAQRARQLVASLRPAWEPQLIVPSKDAPPNHKHREAVTALLRTLQLSPAPGPTLDWKIPAPNTTARQKRLIESLDRHTQELLSKSEQVRRDFMRKLDLSSLDKFVQSQEYYRRYFAEEVIGQFDEPLVPPAPRSRLTYKTDKWLGYEVVLQVWPEVIAYGILLVPHDIKPGEKRPVVVCQHGLEGRPQHVISGKHPAYNDYAARLAEEGFIVFAPQNPYILGDTFRSVQRKCYPLKKTLFSLITAQHRQILHWLKTLPYVDAERIGFYGLSYGGKTAMRVPAILLDYKLSICSADFNDWIWKNASTLSPYSYVWTGEYEIFEFDLGNTFNYAEMAALICPRPFMVERGHFDGVAPDERVAYEFAKVLHLYQARLGIGERCALEWFVGGHTIHGRGTFAFLRRHLQWPVDKPAARQ